MDGGEREEEGEIFPMCESIGHRPLPGCCSKKASCSLTRQFVFGADTGCSGHQKRILVTGATRIEKRPEMSEILRSGVLGTSRTSRRRDERLDAIDDAIAGVDVHASFGVG